MNNFFIKIGAFYTKFGAKLQNYYELRIMIYELFITLHPNSTNMRLEFQKNIASSQFTLPFVSILAILLWIALPTAHTETLALDQYGLWSLLPADFKSGASGKYIALVLCALSVYLVAELTNANVLLRISSRMLSSTLAVLMGVTLCLHTFSPGHILMVVLVLSFFSLFTTYQLPHPIPTFITYLVLSTGALVFPKLLYLIPVYWILQAYLRSLSLRCFFASIFGLLVPCWFFFGIASCFDGGITMFVDTYRQLTDIVMPDYSVLRLTDILIFAYVVVFFLFGMINFYANAYLDKTRTRIIFNVIISHSWMVILFMCFQPQLFHTLLPLLLVDASLVGGHFIALTYNKFSHIYCLVMFVLLVALLIAQIIL